MATREIKEAARSILERPEYVKSLIARLDAGKAPHMETLLHFYAYGKPKDALDLDANVTHVLRWQTTPEPMVRSRALTE